MKYYAKSFPVETIKEHTNELLVRLYEYKKIYEMKLTPLSKKDWRLLELAVKYHDIGKVDIVFQNRIRKNIGEEELLPGSRHDVPHNFLSVMAIPFHKLGLNRDESHLLAQIVAYHHERGNIPIPEYVMSNYRENILPYREEIENEHGIVLDDQVHGWKMNMVTKRIYPNDHLYERYVILKGLLHRLDHSASAHVPIELATEMDLAEHVNVFFKDKLHARKNPLQTFTEKHKNNHLVIVAQTGMGKTEAALLWLGKDKGFFTLPLRVSINAMYSRIIDKNNIAFSKRSEEFGEEAVGLLHSTSFDYLLDIEEGNDETLEKIYSQSKEFANKLILCTVDQILKFPFYYLGFEKEYATMATSKIVIDELQAYDPNIAAVLIRALTMIDQIGGSFMIMTATLPDFYLKALQRELKNPKKQLISRTFIDDSVKRHHVWVRDESILDSSVLEEISEKGKEKKVLVICNTVKRACELYDKLKESGARVSLLHSRFIRIDRARLEKEIMDFVQNDEFGIWVTTQLVEASLDIDFDILFTEMSTLDSQFQRYGRCNRKGKKPVNLVNIHVLTKDVSGVGRGKGSVYHKEIYDYSLQLLEKHKKGLLLESIKQYMVNELYDEERLSAIKSEFKKEFDQALYELKHRPHYDPNLTKGKAQELLRDIWQVQVIPTSFLQDSYFNTIIEKWETAKGRKERRILRKEIEGYSVNISKFWADKMGITECEGIKGLYYISCKYDTEKGLVYEDELFS